MTSFEIFDFVSIIYAFAHAEVVFRKLCTYFGEITFTVVTVSALNYMTYDE